jgi:hypothetical protein
MTTEQLSKGISYQNAIHELENDLRCLQGIPANKDDKTKIIVLSSFDKHAAIINTTGLQILIDARKNQIISEINALKQQFEEL